MTDERGLPAETARHYASGYEGTRLFASAHGELERVRTQEIIARYLPPAPAQILDVGGAVGAYSLWLLDRGYEVRLIDALPLHAELAARSFEQHSNSQLGSARVGDARSLEEPDRSADVVLMMGPLYHLTERADRLQALREAYRVLRPGGFLFAACISRFASLLDGLARNLVDDPAFCDILKVDLESGQHRNPQEHPTTSRPPSFTGRRRRSKKSPRRVFRSNRSLGSKGRRGCCQTSPNVWPIQRGEVSSWTYCGRPRKSRR